MVPALFAILGLSATCLFRHQDCQVSQCIQVSGKRRPPTYTTVKLRSN